MKKNIAYLGILLIALSTVFLFMIVYSSRNDMNSMLIASVAEINEDDDVVIKAARNMASKNIDKIDKKVTYTIKDLIMNNYLTGEEINPVTNDYYDENTRIVVTVDNKTIQDIYISNDLFKNVFSCKNVCYPNDKNVVTFNNDIYQIIKIDQEGYIYITNKKLINSNKNNIDSSLKNYYNEINNELVSNVVSITIEDIEKNKIFDLEEDIVVNTDSGYKLYKYDSSNIENIKESKIKILPVIVLDKNITYMKGDGSKFNPYVLGE